MWPTFCAMLITCPIFEEACAERGLELIVLPPRRPDINGGVERANRIFREEFYARKDFEEYSVRGIHAELTKSLLKYNHYRPHHSLRNRTPIEYINFSRISEASLSHMV